MRYRRYYVAPKSDGSVRVFTIGLFLTASLAIWKSVVGTFIVFVVAFCLIMPFTPGSDAAVAWALSWGVVGATLHLLANYLRRRQRPA